MTVLKWIAGLSFIGFVFLASPELSGRWRLPDFPTGSLRGGTLCAIEIPGICWGFTDGPCGNSPCGEFFELGPDGEIDPDTVTYVCSSDGKTRRHWVYPSCTQIWENGVFLECVDNPDPNPLPGNPAGGDFCFQEQNCGACVPDGAGVMMCTNGNGAITLTGGFMPEDGNGVCPDRVTRSRPQVFESTENLAMALSLKSFQIH